jgi:hypothetical protein
VEHGAAAGAREPHDPGTSNRQALQAGSSGRGKEDAGRGLAAIHWMTGLS